MSCIPNELSCDTPNITACPVSKATKQFDMITDADLTFNLKDPVLSQFDCPSLLDDALFLEEDSQLDLMPQPTYPSPSYESVTSENSEVMDPEHENSPFLGFNPESRTDGHGELFAMSDFQETSFDDFLPVLDDSVGMSEVNNNFLEDIIDNAENEFISVDGESEADSVSDNGSGKNCCDDTDGSCDGSDSFIDEKTVGDDNSFTVVKADNVIEKKKIQMLSSTNQLPTVPTNIAAPKSSQKWFTPVHASTSPVSPSVTVRPIPTKGKQVSMIKVRSDFVKTGDTTRVIKIVKNLSRTSHADTEDKYVEDNNRKSAAVQARINRQKKKEYINSLETDTENLKKDNAKLKSESTKLKKERDLLDREVTYLRSVLANDSALAGLLKNIGQSVSLSTEFSGKRKQTSSSSLDHDYGSRNVKKARSSGIGGGVCLHVDKNNVSLEMCASCSSKSCGSPQD